MLGVIRQSPDFTGFTPLNTSAAQPVFTILQPRSLTESFVFTFDYSGSMGSGPGSRKGQLIQGVKRFMMIDVDLDQKLPIGTVSFASNAAIEHPVVPVIDTQTRDDISV